MNQNFSITFECQSNLLTICWNFSTHDSCNVGIQNSRLPVLFQFRRLANRYQCGRPPSRGFRTVKARVELNAPDHLNRAVVEETSSRALVGTLSDNARLHMYAALPFLYFTNSRQ